MKVCAIMDFPSYEINEQGEIRHIKRKDKPLTPRISGHGYPMVTLYHRGKKIQKAVHRLIAETFIPNPDNLEMVNHKDNDKLNYSIDNLEWVTRGQNIAHGYLIKGRSRRGWRLGTLEYLQKTHNFQTVEELLTFLKENQIQKI